MVFINAGNISSLRLSFSHTASPLTDDGCIGLSGLFDQWCTEYNTRQQMYHPHINRYASISLSLRAIDPWDNIGRRLIRGVIQILTCTVGFLYIWILSKQYSKNVLIMNSTFKRHSYRTTYDILIFTNCFQKWKCNV